MFVSGSFESNNDKLVVWVGGLDSWGFPCERDPYFGLVDRRKNFSG